MSNENNNPVDLNKVLPVINKVTQYFGGLQNVQSFDDFLNWNEKITGSPTLNVEKVGSGAVAGFVSGYAVRHTFKMAALFAGFSFVSLQALNHFGYINVNWKRLEDDARKVFDGKVENNKEVNDAVNKVKEFITKGLPSTSGFALGFFLGLRF